MNSIKTANDLISDSVDSYFAGNEQQAGRYLKDAIEQKMSERFTEVLGKLPEFNPSESN